MKFRIDVVCERDNGADQPHELMTLSRDELVMETLGLTLAEGKQLLHVLQRFIIDHQTTEYLEQHRACSRCGCPFIHNGRGSRRVLTMFGPIRLRNPRWLRCDCDPGAGKTFRPMAKCLPARSSTELQYIETKWASLIPYAKVVDLLNDVLPVSPTLNPEARR